MDVSELKTWGKVGGGPHAILGAASREEKEESVHFSCNIRIRQGEKDTHVQEVVKAAHEELRKKRKGSLCDERIGTGKKRGKEKYSDAVFPKEIAGGKG